MAQNIADFVYGMFLPMIKQVFWWIITAEYVSGNAHTVLACIVLFCLQYFANGPYHELSIPNSWGNMGPIWGRQDPGGPHVGPMNFAIKDVLRTALLALWHGSHDVRITSMKDVGKIDHHLTITEINQETYAKYLARAVLECISGGYCYEGVCDNPHDPAHFWLIMHGNIMHLGSRG